jgi:hypothetical protein
MHDVVESVIVSFALPATIGRIDRGARSEARPIRGR